MAMMNGKLEDSNAEQEKEQIIVKPEWMNKPKADLTEEEKRLVKEYEKKVAIQR